MWPLLWRRPSRLLPYSLLLHPSSSSRTRAAPAFASPPAWGVGARPGPHPRHHVVSSPPPWHSVGRAHEARGGVEGRSGSGSRRGGSPGRARARACERVVERGGGRGWIERRAEAREGERRERVCCGGGRPESRDPQIRRTSEPTASGWRRRRHGGPRRAGGGGCQVVSHRRTTGHLSSLLRSIPWQEPALCAATTIPKV